MTARQTGVDQLADVLADIPAGTVAPAHPARRGPAGLISIRFAFPAREDMEAYRDRHHRTFISDGTMTCWVTYAGEWLDENGHALELAADYFPRT